MTRFEEVETAPASPSFTWRSVVQRMLGHASGAVTMDLYGHLIDRNLWDAAERVGGLSGALADDDEQDEQDSSEDVR